jgi:hypothetical protein
MSRNVEVEVFLSVLWHTLSIRQRFEDHALHQDEVMWKNNGGMFPNHARYHSAKWQKMMGPDDPTVRGRRISEAAMSRARRDYEDSYREPIAFALELVDRIRAAVTENPEKEGGSQDRGHEERIAAAIWKELASDAAVRARLAKQMTVWGLPDVSLVRP